MTNEPLKAGVLLIINCHKAIFENVEDALFISKQKYVSIYFIKVPLIANLSWIWYHNMGPFTL